MKVAFVSPWDWRDPDAWSGMVHLIHRELGSRMEVVDIAVSGRGTASIDRVAARLLGEVGQVYPSEHAAATSRRIGRELTARILEAAPDLVVSVVASHLMAYVDTTVPVVAISDATLPLIYASTGSRRPLGPLRRMAVAVERRSWRRSAACVVTSRWARSSLIADYGVPAVKCTVAQFGPGVPPLVGRVCRTDGSLPPAGSAAGRPLRVLAVIRDWQRKQGGLVVQAVGAARAAGAEIDLTVVGQRPEEVGVQAHWVTLVGEVSRETLADYYDSHDVLIDLARANAASVVVADALAWGMPVVATNVGAIQEFVADRENGFIVSLSDQTVDQAADRLVRLAAPQVLERMSECAARSAKSRTWAHWGEEVVAVCRAAAELSMPRFARAKAERPTGRRRQEFQ